MVGRRTESVVVYRCLSFSMVERKGERKKKWDENIIGGGGEA